MKSSFAYILAALLGYFCAHAVKYFRQPRDKRSLKRFFGTGSFPSSHTAVVTALVVAIFVHEGVSDLLAVAATFASITVYDAVSSRRSIGEQGAALSRLIDNISPNEKKPYVALGHTIPEVIAGALLGAVIGVIVALFITI